LKKVVLLFSLIFSLGFSKNLNSKNPEKVYIYSDKAEFDLKSYHMVYKGNVLIISPEFNATCERADVYLDKEYNPVYIYGYNDVLIENGNIYIKANFFFYDVKNKKIKLKGNVKITINDIKNFKKRKKEKLNARS